ncbi:MAG TPA: hypothetical protein VOB72_14735 [Candidatus Dormibacteraeota bacterium]|nr:hypothetical protein [Candidatus Dormibacteraeota bacterium]
MFWSAETPYEQIRSAQREMQERAQRAQMLAIARREARLAERTAPSRFSKAVRRVRSAQARP